MGEHQRAIIVLGMHRSGTSAITRGLLTLGVDLGENLTPAAESNNSRGFWEDQEIVDINNDVLAYFGLDWHSLLPMGDDRFAELDGSSLEHRALDYLRKSFGKSPIFGLKDPRISRLLPFWLRVLEKSGVLPSFVICSRHPLSVARSLEKRDGFSLQKSLYLWLMHALPSLNLSAGHPRLVLSYDQLMDDPRPQLERLARHLDLPQPGIEEQAAYADGFLSHELRHSHFQPGDDALAAAPAEIRETYRLLEALALEHSRFEDEAVQAKLISLDDQLARRQDLLVAMHQLERQLLEALEESQATIDSLRFVVAKQSQELEDGQKRVRELAHVNQALDEASQALAEMRQSTSWLVTKPLRFAMRMLQGRRGEALLSLRNYVHQMGRSLYWRIPVRHRDRLLLTAYRNMGFAFRGLGHYEQWRRQTAIRLPAKNAAVTNLLDIDSIEPCIQVEGRIGIHLHMFYVDLVPEFRAYLGNMPFAYDLYVSVQDEAGRQACTEGFRGLPHLGEMCIEVVPNQGRDIAPMFCTFGNTLRDCDFVLHLHSKKSLYNNGATEGWREYLCGNLLGSEARIRSIFTLLQSGQTGIVYPQNFERLHYMANTWLANQAMGRDWCRRLGLPQPVGSYFHFPAGSMFWATGEAMRPLFDAGIKLQDFATEAGQKDGTFAHCLERLLVLSSQKQGLAPAIIKSPKAHAWSPWGFDSYLARSHQYLQQQIADPKIKVVAFDIFDTLLLRPLVDAESTKRLTALHVGPELGAKYLRYRAQAEARAREKAGKDIGIEAIFDELGRMADIEKGTLQALRQREEEIELLSVSARPESQELLRYARSLGKPVLLISDMFLPSTLITRMLHNNGILQWDNFYLSCEIGLRKDSGQLYEYVLKQHGLPPEQLLMVGDNERSDVQIPGDMGSNTLHMLKPSELARGLPRFAPLLDCVEGRRDLDAELALGLILRRNFAPVTFSELPLDSISQNAADLLGFNVLGPLLAAFVAWLGKTARNEGIERLYFLSREGKLLKAAYDLWADQQPDAPAAHYLVLSRRAVSVPRLQTLDDVLALARPNYFAGTLENFLESRFGLVLDAQALQSLIKQGLWKQDQLLDISNNDIRHIEPLLQALLPDILAQADEERPALSAYLSSKGLLNEGDIAVVDVGYSGTIQKHLNAFLGRKVHGYYMVTDELIEELPQHHAVDARGCFVDRASRAHIDSDLFAKNFLLEKLLSADDTQVNRYRFTEDGNTSAEFQPLSQEEFDARPVRAQIQQGALDYVREALEIRDRLHPEFAPPAYLAEAIWSQFSRQPSATEEALFQQLVLDDHYCGRGLVS